MGSINQGNNSESLIVFNPKKEIGSQPKNPNLFSQIMTSQENLKFKEMLDQTKGLTAENHRLREENRQQKEMLQSLVQTSQITSSTADSDLENKCS